MDRLVRDLIDLPRDRTGHLQLAFAPLDLDDLMLAAYERLEAMAPGRLRPHAVTGLQPRQVYGDGERRR